MECCCATGEDLIGLVFKVSLIWFEPESLEYLPLGICIPLRETKLTQQNIYQQASRLVQWKLIPSKCSNLLTILVQKRKFNS